MNFQVSSAVSCYLKTLEKVPRAGVQRWKNKAGTRFYTWDRMHGHIEGFDKRGYHVGAFDAQTGIQIKPAERGRRIDV